MTKENLLTKTTKNLPYGVLYHFRDMLGMDRITLRRTPNNIEYVTLPE